MLNKNLLEQRMQSLPFRWGINLLLALVLFLLAKFGSFVGTGKAPLPISILWPASGVALAAILLAGFQAWPGILLGYFCYTLSTLHNGNYFSVSVLASIVISLGSLFQALMAGSIIRSLSSGGYFRTVRDVYIFLVPAGLASCLIASTIGSITLFFYKSMAWDQVFELWLTFWLGDTAGIYIVTPLIIVWLTDKFRSETQNYFTEALLMIGTFSAILFLSAIWRFPIGLLSIPFLLWVTYRFRMHGATLANSIVSLKVIITNFLGFGWFVFFLSEEYTLVLVSFLLVMNATTLVFAAVINEREEAWNLLQDSNKDLQKEVQKHSTEIKEMVNEVYVKEKLASLGMLASGIGRELKGPLVGIENYTMASLDCLNLLQKIFSGIKEKLDPGITLSMRNDFEILENCLHSISLYEKKAFKIVSMLQEQTVRSSPQSLEIKSINLHTLLSRCMDQIITNETQNNPDFNITVIKEFDKKITMIQGFPEDLTHAFKSILDHAFYSIKEKMRRNLPFYEPELRVITEDAGENIEIIFYDNGEGLPEKKLAAFFESFSNLKNYEDATGIGLSMSYDILVHEHHGKIDVQSKKGEFLQVSVVLPKSLKTKKQPQPPDNVVA